MFRRLASFGLCALLLGAGPLLSGQAPSGKPTPTAKTPAPLTAFLGSWEEQWGEPETTDVTYQDRYEVKKGETGGLSVVILERDQVISQVKVEQGRLTFTLKTDAFENQYVLTPQKDGSLKGTATNPKGTFPIVWKRFDPSKPRPAAPSDPE